MAARATRSASRKARLTEAVATGPLGALSHDELGVIVDGLANPLQPVVAVALSSTCRELRTPLRAALESLKQKHKRAKKLCAKMNLSLAELRAAAFFEWDDSSVTGKHTETLGMLLPWLPRLHVLSLNNNGFGDFGMQMLCDGLGRGAAPSLGELIISGAYFGLAGRPRGSAGPGRRGSSVSSSGRSSIRRLRPPTARR